MRYVNLKKRNTSKFLFVSKRLASASLLCLALTAVVVVPLTSKADDAMVKENINITDVVEIDNEYFNNDKVDVNNSEALDR